MTRVMRYSPPVRTASIMNRTPSPLSRDPGAFSVSFEIYQLFDELRKMHDFLTKFAAEYPKQFEAALSKFEREKRVAKGEQGNPGNPGKPADESAIESRLFARLSAHLITEVPKRIKVRDGDPGKNADEQKITETVMKWLETTSMANEETFMQKMFEKISSGGAIKMGHIDGLDAKLRSISNKGAYVHGGGDTVVAGSGVTITKNAAGRKVIAATGTGATFETPTGTVDGSNKTFTVTHTPLFIIVDGITYFANNGYTISVLTVTTTVAPSGFIRSAY